MELFEIETWIKEQKLIENQIEKDIEYCLELLTFNRNKLKYQRELVQKITDTFEEIKKTSKVTKKA